MTFRREAMKKKQMDTTTITYLAAGAALVVVMTLFGISAFLSINSIVVYGAATYTPEEVAQASGKIRGDSLLYLSRDGVASSIMDELTYVSDVSVTRQLPDTLVIEITESAPVAYITFAGNALVINSSGRVLEIMPQAVGMRVISGGNALIEVRGVAIDEATAGEMPVLGQGMESNFTAMRDILQAMEREKIAKDVNYLDVANVTNISFGYMDMYRVILGGQRGYSHKISGLPSSISQIQQSYPNARGTFNMTDPSGLYTFQVE